MGPALKPPLHPTPLPLNRNRPTSPNNLWQLKIHNRLGQPNSHLTRSPPQQVHQLPGALLLANRLRTRPLTRKTASTGPHYLISTHPRPPQLPQQCLWEL